MASLQSTTINGSNTVTGAQSAQSGTITTNLTFDNHPNNGLRMQAGGQAGASYRTINGFTFKHLGQFNFRADGQYFDARTNLTGGSIMYKFHVIGYLYNNGIICGWAGGYTYNPSGPNAILNMFVQNIGQSVIMRTYRSNGQLCIKLNRNSSGYTEGQVDIYFHTHDVGTQNSAVVNDYAMNNTANNFYT